MLRVDVPVGRMAGGHLVPVRGQLTYEAADPLAVRLVLRSGGQRVEWFCSRDLLIEGLRRPSGVGDVRVSPSWRRGMRVVVLELGALRDAFEVPRRALEAFLLQSLEVVPLGEEGVAALLEQEFGGLEQGWARGR